jgi:hypothetical protein
VHALGPLLGVRLAAADGQRATGADDLALGDEALSTSASAGIRVSAA